MQVASSCERPTCKSLLRVASRSRHQFSSQKSPLTQPCLNTAVAFKILVAGLPALASLPIPEMVARPESTKSGMATAALSAARALGSVVGARVLGGATSSGS